MTRQRGARRRAVGPDVGLDPREQRLGPGLHRVMGVRLFVGSAQDQLHLAGVPSPGREQGLTGSSAVGSSLRRPSEGLPRASAAMVSQRAGEGCSKNRWTSRYSASARRTCKWPAGRRVSPNSETRGGRSRIDASSRSRMHALSSRSAGPGSAIRARRRRQSSGCHAASLSTAPAFPSVSCPVAQARTIVGRCSAYRSNSSATCRTVLKRRACRTGSGGSAVAPR